MITEFSLENFRVFRDKATFKIKPITILTGPNNSGKSSVNKALLLMKNTLESLKATEPFDFPTQLKFDHANLNLGDITQFINAEQKNEEITFALSFSRPYFPYPFKVEYSYKRIAPDNKVKDTLSSNIYLANSYLTSMKVYMLGEVLMELNYENDNNFVLEGGETFYKWKINFKLLENLLIDFAYANYRNERNFRYSQISPDLNRLLFVDLKALLGEEPLSELLLNLMKVYIGVPAPPDEDDREKHLTKTEIGKKIKSIELFNKISELLKKGTSPDEIVNYFTFDQEKNTSGEFIWYLIENAQNSSAIDVYELLHIDKLIDYFSTVDIQYQLGITWHQYFYSSRDELIDKNKYENELKRARSAFLRLNEYYSNYYNYPTFLIKFADAVLKEIFTQLRTDFRKIRAIPSIKGNDKRSYSLSDKSFFVDSLKKFFDSQEMIILTGSKTDDDVKEKTYSFMLKNIFECTNGYELKVEYNPEYNVLIPYLAKEGVKRNLNDFGTGIRNIISIIIMAADTRVVYSSDTKNLCILEEPETNLHPAFQSKLANLFSMASVYFNNFLIETHSEYFIRKLQYLVAKGECNPDDVVIYYIDNPDPEQRAPGAPQVREITLERNGRMSHDFGPGFFDEADNLAIQLFNINQNSN